mmetsp:Transcript_10841/g.21966  ORF Transcript_10841/g.21966 Transcript_10841/m.21966 type:complete len:93 (-) Transcript_10841:184-462(-)
MAHVGVGSVCRTQQACTQPCVPPWHLPPELRREYGHVMRWDGAERHQWFHGQTPESPPVWLHGHGGRGGCARASVQDLVRRGDGTWVCCCSG